MRWPFPGDAPVVRARRVALAYRQVAERADPRAAAALDSRMVSWGQWWAVPRPVAHDPHEWISARDAADLACVDPATLRTLRRRGRLTGRRKGRTYEYRVADIEALKSGRSRANPSVSVTLDADSTSVPAAGNGG